MALNPTICYHRYGSGKFCHERSDARVHAEGGDHAFKRLEVVNAGRVTPVWVKLLPVVIIGLMIAATLIFGGDGP